MLISMTVAITAVCEFCWLLQKEMRYEGVSKSFRTESVAKYTLNIRLP
jgi:hypothetical protein